MEDDYKYDMLKMYFGRDYYVTDKIVIHEPTIGDIINFGESRFWSVVLTLCANTTSVRLMLWRNGIDWNKMTDYELFITLINSLEVEDTKLLFGDLDFTKFKPVTVDEEVVLVYLKDPNIYIDEKIYERMVGYLRIMLDVNPKVEKAKGKTTKEALIWEDENNLEIQKNKQKDEKWHKSMLLPLISSLLNNPGFKYKKKELEEVGMVEFMDSVKRLRIYENVRSLMTGIYMGMMDLSKMDLEKELNWMKDIYE